MRDAAVFELVGESLSRFTRVWFRFRMFGLDTLPDGPVLIVGNHSGFGHVDVLCVIGAWYAAHGAERPAVGLMSDPLIDLPGIGALPRALGAVNASQANARKALSDGLPVLVYPGGELDSCRPFHQPRQVVFGPRRGYIRLALDTGVPVVPLATVGSHWTCPMLPGGRILARLTRPLGLRCDRVPLPMPALLSVLLIAAGATGLLPAVLAASLACWVWFPWPARVRARVLPAIDVAGATAHIADEEARVEAAHALVHGALQEAVSALPLGVTDVRHPTVVG